MTAHAPAEPDTGTRAWHMAWHMAWQVHVP